MCKKNVYLCTVKLDNDMRYFLNTRSPHTKRALALAEFPDLAPRDGWRQVMMLMHDDPNLASLRHSRRSYLTIDEYHYILNRLHPQIVK